MKVSHVISILFILVIGLAGCDQSTNVSFQSGEIRAVLNPHGNSPLSAVVSLESDKTRIVKYTVYGRLPYTREIKESDEKEVIVTALYPDTVNQVELTIAHADGKTSKTSLDIKTGPLPAYLPEINVKRVLEVEKEPGWNLVDFHVGSAGRFRSAPFIFEAVYPLGFVV